MAAERAEKLTLKMPEQGMKLLPLKLYSSINHFTIKYFSLQHIPVYLPAGSSILYR